MKINGVNANVNIAILYLPIRDGKETLDKDIQSRFHWSNHYLRDINIKSLPFFPPENIHLTTRKNRSFVNASKFLSRVSIFGFLPRTWLTFNDKRDVQVVSMFLLIYLVFIL